MAATAWLFAAAGAGEGADVDGLYMLSADGDCARVGEEGGALRVARGVLYGVDSECRMLNPVPVRNMNADLVDMVCAGEGTEWSERAMVMRGAEGQLILVWNGYAFSYPRCADQGPPFVPAVRPRPRPE